MNQKLMNDEMREKNWQWALKLVKDREVIELKQLSINCLMLISWNNCCYGNKQNAKEKNWERGFFKIAELLTSD